VAAVAVMWTPIRCIRRRVGMAAAPRAATRTVKWQRRNEGLSSLLGVTSTTAVLSSAKLGVLF
jgi:hypothetical protein